MQMNSIRWTSLAIIFGVLGSLAHAQTDSRVATLTFEPGIYAGEYKLTLSTGETVGPLTGTQTIELPVGEHRLAIATGDAIPFNSDQTGCSQTPTHPAVRCRASKLIFNTSTVRFRTNEFAGGYKVARVEPEHIVGDRPVVLVKGVTNWYLNIGTSSVQFSTDPGGNVLQPADVGLRADRKRLVFEPVPILVHPVAFEGTVSVERIDAAKQGPRTVQLIPGLTNYFLKIRPSNALTLRMDMPANGEAPATIPFEIIESSGELTQHYIAFWRIES
ncbi:hypothetical protein [Hyphomonas sp.]|jgi:hypothetical protein|uniref:hypothetical protein n=1 Tax=Hyphomonas sp. TaxID=87 RepID=UPI003528E8BC